VPLAAHASRGGTGTEESTSDEAYIPAYSRRSRTPEIVSDTGEIVSFLEQATEDDPAGHSERPSATGALDSVDPASANTREADLDTDATHPRAAAPSAQPFWILAPTERDVHDERGEPLFRVGPNAWALVIEDRGGAFVVRHDDGRIGYLHDISDITKG
jgi:hypothetical protein